MVRTIEVSVRDRIAWQTNRIEYICGNSDFVVDFAFDDEWANAEHKTARFIHGEQHTDVLFTGNRCAIPKIIGAIYMQVGVYAGDLRTTTAAVVLCKKSILCDDGTPADPLPDVYTQLLEKLNSLNPNESGDTYPIKRIESLDEENLVNLRDIEDGIYILYGYFKPFPGSDSTLIIDNGFYMVTRVEEGSHLLSISPLNFKMTCHEILVDDTNEKGFTYTNSRINLLDIGSDVETIQRIVNEYLETNPPSGGVNFETDETLKLENGILSVNTTNEMEQDNTLPITSAGVYATVGNIEALLKTI